MKVVDNFLPKEQFEKLRDICLGNSFPYYYIRTVNDNQKKSDKKMFYFIHFFYKNGRGTSSEWYPMLHQTLLRKINYSFLIRAKANCYPRSDRKITHPKHLDYKSPTKGLILSLNTCNGATILENGKEVKSVANRALFFNPSKPHASTNCTDQHARFNINVNYI
jgi:hypothetical protein